ncbi:MAG: DNA recombination protein RmuC [Actinomycetes bacterium]
MQAVVVGSIIVLITVVVIAALSIKKSLGEQSNSSFTGAPVDQAALVASIRSAVEAEMRKTAQETLQATSQQSAEFFAAQQRNIENQTRALLSPFEEQIKGLSGSVTALQTTYSQEQGTVAQLAVQITSLQSTTTTLTNSLKSPTARGSWGENQLRNVIQLAGMEPYCDYSEQFTGGAAEADQRPDVVVRLPNGALIAIDSKAPLSAYLRMQEATDIATKELELKNHARVMRDHMKALARKEYWNQFPEAPDFVVMFIPGEGFVSDAMRSDPTLLDDAMKSRVLVASPVNLLALLFAVAKGWQAHSIAEHAKEVAALGSELYERVGVILTHVSKMGTHLNTSTTAYNDMIGSLEGRMLPTLRKFRDLKVVQGKEIDPLKSIDSQTRSLNAPESTPELN